MEDMDNPQPYYRRSKSAWLGIIILCGGVLLLLHRMGVVFIPDWVFTWPVFLIVIGLAIGARSGFRDFRPMIIVLVGAFFLARHQLWIPLDIWRFVWPAIIIAVGIAMIVRPKRNMGWGSSQWQDGGETAAADVLDSVAVFYGAKKNITSKNFKRGEAVNIFGGTELNFMNADINGTAVLDIVAVFGGVKIIVPKDWEVQIKMVHIFGGTDDKRGIHPTGTSRKVLVLTGSVIFGGVDVNSY